jgi:hypothetical protein
VVLRTFRETAGSWLGCWVSAASADLSGCTSEDEGGQAGANQGPKEGADEGQVDGEAGAEPGGDGSGHQPGGADPWSAPLIESWGLRFGVRRSLRSSAGRQERDQQGGPEQIANVLDGVAGSEIAGLDDIHDMDDGRPDAKDCGRDDGGLTEAIAPAHGDNAEDAEGQAGGWPCPLGRRGTGGGVVVAGYLVEAAAEVAALDLVGGQFQGLPVGGRGGGGAAGPPLESARVAASRW